MLRQESGQGWDIRFRSMVKMFFSKFGSENFSNFGSEIEQKKLFVLEKERTAYCGIVIWNVRKIVI